MRNFESGIRNLESGIGNAEGKEVRTVQLQGLEIRESAGEVSSIVGHAAVFNQRTLIWDFWEQIAPGAFSRTLADDPDVRATIEHEGGLTTIGRTKNGSLTLREDVEGLQVNILPPDTQAGRDALTLVRDGYVNQMSFMFRVREHGEVWSQAEDGKPLRTLVDIELNDGDVSLVTYPAYAQTTAYARDMAAATLQAVGAGDDNQAEEVAGLQARSAYRKRQIEIERLK